MTPKFRRILPLLLIATSAFGAKLYAYRGAECTVSEIQPRAAASALTDFTTYIGDGPRYIVRQIAADAVGNTYIVGGRTNASTDVFVSKLDATGALVFTATFSGKALQMATAVTVDASSNIYVDGYTSSADFPLLGALQKKLTSLTSFLFKLSPDGSHLIYSTLFGGTNGRSSPGAIAVDADGNAYIAGSTSATDFPSSPGLRLSPASSQPLQSTAYFAKIASAGNRVVYSGLLGGKTVKGSSNVCSIGGCSDSVPMSSVSGLALDAAHNLYLAGTTNVTDFPVSAGAFHGAGGVGAFITKVAADGSGLTYSTFLSDHLNHSKAPANQAAALAVDAAGNAYVAGTTSDSAFPVTTGVLNRTIAASSHFGQDIFVAKLDLTGSSLVWATYLGAEEDYAWPTSIALDPQGNLWIAGTTLATNFPNKNGWDAAGPEYLAELNASATTLHYSARFPANTVGQSIALDSAGVLHLAGATGLISTITPGRAFHARIGGIASSADDTLGGNIAPSELITIRGSKLGPATLVAHTLDADGRVPKRLAGVTVKIGGIAAPLLSVSANEIRAVVPAAVAPGTAPVSVSYNGATTPEFEAPVSTVRPSVFRAADTPSTGTGETSSGRSLMAAALNEDGTVNSQDHPAKAGSVVSIWATGTGAAHVPDGTITAQADASAQVCTLIGAKVLYAGPAPGMVAGVTQINFIAQTGDPELSMEPVLISCGETQGEIGQSVIWAK